MTDPSKQSRNIEIRTRDLHKAFGENRVLRGIDLTLYRGDFVAIVGGSGCGKTVLLNHMLGLLTPDKGSVEVCDHDKPEAPLVDLTALGQADIDRIHTHWGVVFQGNALFSGTVYDNLALWLKEVRNLDDEAVIPIAAQALKDVALPNDPEFLQTETHSLSGGMSKRLAVARAIAMSPQVLFYDEPTTGLDPASASQIHNLLLKTHELGHSRTTVIITHDKDLLSRLAPRTVMLDNGQILFDGSYADFEAASSVAIRPYFEQMPLLHHRVPV